MDAFPFFLGIAAFVLGLVLATAWHRRNRSRRASSRAQSGLHAEEDAARLLEEHGYRILEHPYSLSAHILVNGERRESSLRADYLVVKKGIRFLVEVKSTARAADPTLPETRRQLLEYALATPHPVLLVDMDRQDILRVGFDYERSAWVSSWWFFGLGVGVGALALWLY